MENEQTSKPITKENGIRKAARWVARMFGYKAENKFARAVWYVFITSAALLTLYFVIAITILVVDEIREEYTCHKQECMENSSTYLHDYCNSYVSPYVIYHDDYPSYLFNTLKGERTLTGISWICKSSDGDSLTYYCTIEDEGGKRGYFNRFTGEDVIPAQFDKAWIFSEGLACVYENGKVHFIDHKGKDTMEKTFPYTERIDDYCFHEGLCMMLGDNERIGLIDKRGNWAVEPQYFLVQYDTKGFWLVQDNDEHYGLLDAKGKELLPIEYNNITVHHDDSCIFVRRLDHINQVLDFDCKVLNPCNYTDIEPLTYQTGEFDEYDDPKLAATNCVSYRTTEWYYGLMDKKGNILTPPIYSDITAIAPDRFHCDGPHGSFVLDDKGKVCGERQ